MPGKTGVWENPEFLKELSLALFQVASNGGALSIQAKSSVEAYLKFQGHDQSWESIRAQSAAVIPFLRSLFVRFPFSSLASTLPVTMGRSQMKWDSAAHEDMLICVVKHCDLGSANMVKVLQDMQQKGYEFTENAFRQHIQKLRKARDTSALDGSGDGSASKPSTPRKATPRKTPNSGRKRKQEIDEDADELGFDHVKDEDEDDTKASPSKRVKNEPSSETADWKKSVFNAPEV